MKNKFCNYCGEKLENGQNICPNCNNKIIVRKEKSILKLILDIIRYAIGSFLILISIGGLLEKDWVAIISIIWGFSIYPCIYDDFLNKYISSTKFLKGLQLLNPLALFVIFCVAFSIKDGISSDTNNENYYIEENNDSDSTEKTPLKVVKTNLHSAYETIISSDINSETGNYDFKIKDDKSQLSAYDCATDAQYLARQVSGIENVGNIEYECAKNSETFYYVLIENVGSVSSESINDNTKYYDVNHNIINTNIDTLKANVVNDYKKSCATYSYKDVLRNSSNYNGKQAYWFGEIVQVVDKSSYSSTFRVDVTCEKYTYSSGYYCDDTIYVTYYGDKSFIEDDMVKMWGTMDGTQTYTTVLGASVTIPKFEAQYMELQN